MAKKIAVVLSGCGYLDGAEIREAVGVLWALSQAHSQAQCFAPDLAQYHVMDTLAGEPAQGESRNALIEAARIARGDVQPLSKLRAADFDALVMPGGYGVAKNLCDFAFKGSQGKVLPEMRAALEGFRAAHKPIGAICIAPALVALSFAGQGLELTVGAPGETAQEIEKLGHKHVVCSPSEIHIDPKHRVISTPAYMYDDAPLHEVFTGIQKLVAEVIRLSA